MNLEDTLVTKIENLGPLIWKRMFGMQAILISGKLMGGYKKIDENVIKIILLLSAKGYEKAMDNSYFSKFDFGKTWVEGEITSEEDLDLVWGIIEDSYSFITAKPGKNKVK